MRRSSRSFDSVLVIALCAGLLAPGCAASTRATGASPASAPQSQRTREVMAAYAQQLPVGKPVRIVLDTGRTLRGTLMRTDGQSLVVQLRTRWPEPPIEVPLDTVALLEPTTPSTLGKAIAVGVTTGAAGAVGLLLFLAAVLD